jgi:hypothetical protein
MISDYSTLQSAVASWLHRADLAQRIPDFISLAGTRIAVDLRLSNQQKVVSGSSTGGVIALPDDFRQAQALMIPWGNTERELPLRPPAAVPTVQGASTAGYVVGNTIVVNGEDVTYRLVYFSGVPALSDASPTNWVITTYPNVYLYASLLEAMPYLRDDARINVWGAGYQNAIGALAAQDDRLRYSHSRQTVSGATP